MHGHSAREKGLAKSTSRPGPKWGFQLLVRLLPVLTEGENLAVIACWPSDSRRTRQQFAAHPRELEFPRANVNTKRPFSCKCRGDKIISAQCDTVTTIFYASEKVLGAAENRVQFCPLCPLVIIGLFITRPGPSQETP